MSYTIYKGHQSKKPMALHQDLNTATYEAILWAIEVDNVVTVRDTFGCLRYSVDPHAPIGKRIGIYE